MEVEARVAECIRWSGEDGRKAIPRRFPRSPRRLQGKSPPGVVLAALNWPMQRSSSNSSRGPRSSSPPPTAHAGIDSPGRAGPKASCVGSEPPGRSATIQPGQPASFRRRQAARASSSPLARASRSCAFSKTVDWLLLPGSHPYRTIPRPPPVGIGLLPVSSLALGILDCWSFVEQRGNAVSAGRRLPTN